MWGVLPGLALTTPSHGFGSEFGISSPPSLPLVFAETPLVSPGESGSVAAAVVFGCYGSRQRVLGRKARLECGPLESGDATVLRHNVGLLQLELERGH